MQTIFKLSVISSTLLISQFALAAPHNSIIVNPASADTTRIVTQNNKTTVDISPANNHGVSYNSYNAFNVDKNGVTFNNQTAGADLIINEVVTDQKSHLNGNMHIDGQKAHLVIANPNGITCNGCSVSGADQLTLAGGKIMLYPNNTLQSYNNENHKSNIRINNINKDNFSSVSRFNIIAENIIVRNSDINTPNLTVFTGYEAVKYSPNTVRGLEAWFSRDTAQKSKLTISQDSHIKTDNMYISANNTNIKNHGNIEVGPVGSPQKQKYMNSYLTMDLINSKLINGSKGNIQTTAVNSILANSEITNNGAINIDNNHKMLSIGNAVINNKGSMSSGITEITGSDKVKAGVGINNHGNLTGSLLVKANEIAFNNQKYLEALDISTDSDVLVYINNGEIMNETAKFRAYELYYSDNGKITSQPVFESEIKKTLQ